MAEQKQGPSGPEPESESPERPEDEAPTEEHETAATETQASELATVEVLAEEIEELRARAAERDELLDKLQRTKADFINYQKRLQRERERWSEMAKQDLVLPLLAVLDDFERALEAARQSDDVEPITHGFELIQSKFLKALSDQGITALEALGKPFDPAFHEAVARVEKPDVTDQTVIEVVRRGYMAADRVLRAAQVVVAKGERPDDVGEASPEKEEGEEEKEL